MTATAPTFTIAREDGRSNTQVLLDCVRPGEPGRVFSYDDLAAALEVGSTTRYDRAAIASIVRNAYGRLLREQQRTLINVRGRGYRLAHAKDHRGVALVRTRKADAQIQRGIQVVQNVRWDELDPVARQVHEGTLLIVGGLYHQQQAMDKRFHAIERAIAATTRESLD